MQRCRLQRLAQHQISLFFCVAQYRRVELAADHRPADLWQAFKQRLEDFKTAFTRAQSLIAQPDAWGKSPADNSKTLCGGSGAAHNDPPTAHQTFPGGGDQRIVINHKAASP